jgi:hypothetical protein
MPDSVSNSVAGLHSCKRTQQASDTVASCHRCRFVAMGEPVPGAVEGAQPLSWGLETYDPFVDMEETART